MKGANRLSGGEIGRYLADCPDDCCDIVLGLRDVVLDTAPNVCEAIKFNALCYFKPTHAYGAIGGNVCMIDFRKGYVELGFIHGAFIPDPEGLLRGSGKAKRHISIFSLADARRSSVRALIRAAFAHTPAAKDERP